MHKSILIIALVALTSAQAKVRQFKIINDCKQTIWPGMRNNPNITTISSAPGSIKVMGFELKPGADKTFPVPDEWAGRIWGRTGCKQTGDKFVCETGDCEGSDASCGKSGRGDVTLSEFTLAPEGGKAADWYDVSLVDAFNLPMRIEPSKGCKTRTCSADITAMCPKELKSAGGAACLSACQKGFAKGIWKQDNGTEVAADRNCCSGPFNVPELCTVDMIDYYHLFKKSCPEAYMYAYDDKAALTTCDQKIQADYTITFCPASAGEQPSAPSRRGDSNYQAVNVCNPPGWSLLSGGGDQKPKGNCVPQPGNASIPAQNIESTPASEAKPSATISAQKSSQTPSASTTPIGKDAKVHTSAAQAGLGQNLVAAVTTSDPAISSSTSVVAATESSTSVTSSSSSIPAPAPKVTPPDSPNEAACSANKKKRAGMKRVIKTRPVAK